MIITLDPETGEKTPAVLKTVAQAHEGMAGVYGAVLVEGMVRKGDFRSALGLAQSLAKSASESYFTLPVQESRE